MRGETRPQLFVRMVQFDGDRGVSSGPREEEITATGGDGLYRSVEQFSRHSVDANLDRLADLHIYTVAFIYLCGDLHLVHVDDVRNGAAGVDLVALLILGEGHSTEKDPSCGTFILANNDEPVDRRAHLHVLDVFLRLIHGQLRLVSLLLIDGDGRLPGSGVRVDVLLQLLEGSFCLTQSKLTFLSVDGANQILLADFQFGLPHVKARFQKRGLVLSGLNRGIVLCLHDLLFGLIVVGAGLLEVVLLLAWIEIKHGVARLHLRASLEEMDDLQAAAANRRRDQHCGTRGAQRSGGIYAELHVGLLDGGNRDAAF